MYFLHTLLAARMRKSVNKTMKKPHFSLIMPTYGRSQDLHQFLACLFSGSFQDYELLIMDQNSDDRVQVVVDSFPRNEKVRVLRTPRGASLARNRGMSLAVGEILAFPDDDCWYPVDLLQNVATWMKTHPEYDVFSVGSVDENGLPSGNRWLRARCRITPLNSFRTTFCSSLFIRNISLVKSASFDESAGPGTAFGFGGEETDFVLQLYRAGVRGYFDRRYKIIHPRRDMLSGTVDKHRAQRYGFGIGLVLRKNTLWATWISLLAYAGLRWICVAATGRFESARLCWSNMRGIYMGFTQRTEAV